MESGDRLPETRAEESLKTYSCLVCRQRKVRCDHAQPCGNCRRAKIDCEYVAPLRGKRKRSNTSRETLQARLRRYEDMLKTRGVDVEEQTSAARAASEDDPTEINEAMESPTSLSVPTPREELAPPIGYCSALIKTPGTGPRLVTKEGNTRYYENSSLWTDMNDDFHHPDDIVVSVGDDEDHEADLLLGAGSPSNNFNGQLRDWHPPMPVLCTLKDIYVDRVDPLMKIIHMPTFWALVLQTVEKGEQVLKPVQAMVFCFYFGTISILEEKECEKLFKQSKRTMFAKYRTIARHTLKEAGLISTSSPMTLRAFCVFLMGMRRTMRHESQYIMCGVALRLAQKMGLHRDGTSLGLSLFETEMRRRLWWYIAHLDFRTSDLLGAKPSLDIHTGDVQVPWNVEDEDLQPSMTKVPENRKAITSITMCLVRCDLAKSLQRLSGTSTTVASWGDIGPNSNVTLRDKDALINDIEDKLETKYLRYCDPSRPLDIMVTCMIRAAICNTRLFAHNPRRFADSGGQVSEAERDTSFHNASKLLEYAAMVSENQALRKYEWRMNSTYLWDKILYVLIEARRRTPSPELDRVWELIGRVFLQYPDAFGQSSAQAVYEVLSKWTLEVWGRYIMAKRVEDMLEPEEPAYIKAMRERKESMGKEAAGLKKQQQPMNKEALESPCDSEQALETIEAREFGGFSDLGLFETSVNEWVNWEQLVTEQSCFYHVEGW